MLFLQSSSLKKLEALISESDSKAKALSLEQSALVRCPIIAAQHMEAKLNVRKYEAEVARLNKLPVSKDAAEAAKVAAHITALTTAATLATAMVAANKAAVPKMVPPPTLAELTAVCCEIFVISVRIHWFSVLVDFVFPSLCFDIR